MNHKLPAKIIAQILPRLFLLQASWNFERLQSLGALYVMAPGLRFLYQGQELSMAFQRHLSYFNTHPYMASPVLGAALALEEAGTCGQDSMLGVGEFKEMTMAPYAAMGDALFWGALRPLAAAVSLFFAIKGSLWAPVVFLLLFNTPHLWMRVGGFFRGYRSGLQVVEILQKRSLPDLALRIKEATVVLLGGLTAFLSFQLMEKEEIFPLWGFGILAAVGGVAWMIHRRASILFMVMFGVFLLIVMAWFGS
ncbi:MAG: PTS system mannose/fructose/sorbose family transporter subunit IID [Desulfuromonadales bacterium]|uniref:PTS system mannose/fructose/sorbose family transporter subunit IID n=1 Tax=Desulfuromonas sp. KJ2020 TaxID=2919173 RepID=UPI0020A7BBEA|nr:PTS system mannose/fructose/sorbose family transporter subunit IID [Desulfuromonas sp. KJ2020]MCP3178074.1 PTS system mannose/fructose/sorbose family transporter subunit IID [Desulfuromonas sp. KJ2020]